MGLDWVVFLAEQLNAKDESKGEEVGGVELTKLKAREGSRERFNRAQGVHPLFGISLWCLSVSMCVSEIE